LKAIRTLDCADLHVHACIAAMWPPPGVVMRDSIEEWL